MYVLIDKKYKKIFLDLKASTKQEAKEILRKEEKRYKDSIPLIENLTSVGKKLDLIDDLAFYTFKEVQKPEFDPITEVLLDGGYKILSSTVEREWQVEDKSFDDMLESVLKYLRKKQTSEVAALTVNISDFELSFNAFLEQSFLAHIHFTTSAEDFKIKKDENTFSFISQDKLENKKSSLSKKVVEIVEAYEDIYTQVSACEDTESLKNVFKEVL